MQRTLLKKVQPAMVLLGFLTCNNKIISKGTIVFLLGFVLFILSIHLFYFWALHAIAQETLVFFFFFFFLRLIIKPFIYIYYFFLFFFFKFECYLDNRGFKKGVIFSRVK